jgi:hypothetical protein
MSRNMRAADACPANMRSADMRPAAAACPEAYSAAVPPKPAEMSAAAVSAATMSAATMPAAAVSSAAVPAATAAAGLCFECEKRHDEEQHRGNASAGRQYRTHGAAGVGTPHPRGRLSLGIPPRTKSF